MKALRLSLLLVFVTLFAGCCGCHKWSSSGKLFEQTKWTLVEMEGRSVKADDNFYLNFDPKEKRVNGRGDCNSVMGSYEIGDAGQLKLSYMASTRMMCPNQALEDQFVGVLNKVTSYKIDGKMLMLFSDGEMSAVFEAK